METTKTRQPNKSLNKKQFRRAESVPIDKLAPFRTTRIRRRDNQSNRLKQNLSENPESGNRPYSAQHDYKKFLIKYSYAPKERWERLTQKAMMSYMKEAKSYRSIFDPVFIESFFSYQKHFIVILNKVILQSCQTLKTFHQDPKNDSLDRILVVLSNLQMDATKQVQLVETFLSFTPSDEALQCLNYLKRLQIKIHHINIVLVNCQSLVKEIHLVCQPHNSQDFDYGQVITQLRQITREKINRVKQSIQNYVGHQWATDFWRKAYDFITKTVHKYMVFYESVHNIRKNELHLKRILSIQETVNSSTLNYLASELVFLKPTLRQIASDLKQANIYEQNNKHDRFGLMPLEVKRLKCRLTEIQNKCLRISNKLTEYIRSLFISCISFDGILKSNNQNNNTVNKIVQILTDEKNEGINIYKSQFLKEVPVLFRIFQETQTKLSCILQNEIKIDTSEGQKNIHKLIRVYQSYLQNVQKIALNDDESLISTGLKNKHQLEALYMKSKKILQLKTTSLKQLFEDPYNSPNLSVAQLTKAYTSKEFCNALKQYITKQDIFSEFLIISYKSSIIQHILKIGELINSQSSLRKSVRLGNKIKPDFLNLIRHTQTLSHVIASIEVYYIESLFKKLLFIIMQDINPQKLVLQFKRVCLNEEYKQIQLQCTQRKLDLDYCLQILSQSSNTLINQLRLHTTTKIMDYQLVYIKIINFEGIYEPIKSRLTQLLPISKSILEQAEQLFIRIFIHKDNSQVKIVENIRHLIQTCLQNKLTEIFAELKVQDYNDMKIVQSLVAQYRQRIDIIFKALKQLQTSIQQHHQAPKKIIPAFQSTIELLFRETGVSMEANDGGFSFAGQTAKKYIANEIVTSLRENTYKLKPLDYTQYPITAITNIEDLMDTIFTLKQSMIEFSKAVEVDKFLPIYNKVMFYHYFQIEPQIDWTLEFDALKNHVSYLTKIKLNLDSLFKRPLLAFIPDVTGSFIQILDAIVNCANIFLQKFNNTSSVESEDKSKTFNIELQRLLALYSYNFSILIDEKLQIPILALQNEAQVKQIVQRAVKHIEIDWSGQNLNQIVSTHLKKTSEWTYLLLDRYQLSCKVNQKMIQDLNHKPQMLMNPESEQAYVALYFSLITGEHFKAAQDSIQKFSQSLKNMNSLTYSAAEEVKTGNYVILQNDTIRKAIDDITGHFKQLDEFNLHYNVTIDVIDEFSELILATPCLDSSGIQQYRNRATNRKLFLCSNQQDTSQKLINEVCALISPHQSLKKLLPTYVKRAISNRIVSIDSLENIDSEIVAEFILDSSEHNSEIQQIIDSLNLNPTSKIPNNSSTLKQVGEYESIYSTFLKTTKVQTLTRLREKLANSYRLLNILSNWIQGLQSRYREDQFGTYLESVRTVSQLVQGINTNNTKIRFLRDLQGEKIGVLSGLKPHMVEAQAIIEKYYFINTVDQYNQDWFSKSALQVLTTEDIRTRRLPVNIKLSNTQIPNKIEGNQIKIFLSSRSGQETLYDGPIQSHIRLSLSVDLFEKISAQYLQNGSVVIATSDKQYGFEEIIFKKLVDYFGNIQSSDNQSEEEPDAQIESKPIHNEGEQSTHNQNTQVRFA